MPSPEVSTFRKPEIKKNKMPISIVVWDKATRGVDVVSTKAVDAYWDTRTAMRRRLPVGLQPRLSKSEAYQVGALDPQDPKNEKKLRRDPEKKREWQEKVRQSASLRDARREYLEKEVFPQSLFDRLINLAVDEETQVRLIRHRDEQRELFKGWMDATPTAVVATAFSNSLLSTLAYLDPEVSLLVAGAGYAASQVGVHATAQTVELQNHLARLAVGEVGLTLKRFMKEYGKTTANFVGLSEATIGMVTQDIYNGGRAFVEGENDRYKLIGTLTIGAGTQLAMHADSLRSLALNLLGPAIVGWRLSAKEKKLQKKFATHYSALQKAYVTELENFVRENFVSNGEKVDDTALIQTRYDLVGKIIQNNKEGDSVKAGILWEAVFGVGLANLFKDVGESQWLDLSAAIINGSIVRSSFPNPSDINTRNRLRDVAEMQREALNALLTEIENSPYHMITINERKTLLEKFSTEGVTPVQSFDEAMNLMADAPLNVNNIDITLGGKHIYFEPGISFLPGISVIQGPNGTGKTLITSMMALEVGNLEALLESRNGIDLRRLSPEARKRYFMRADIGNEALEETTAAEQMKQFIFDREHNLFKGSFNALIETTVDLSSQFGQKRVENMIALLLSYEVDSKGLKHALVDQWIKQPLPSSDDTSDSALASRLLTKAFAHYLGDLFPDITTDAKAADFLTRIPGGNRGTSNGEAVLFRLKKVLSRQYGVLILDEPTVFLSQGAFRADGTTKKIIDKSATERAVNEILAYNSRYRQTPLIVVTHDNIFINWMQNISKQYYHARINNLITPTITQKGIETDICWQASALDSSSITEAYIAAGKLKGPLHVPKRNVRGHELTQPLDFEPGKIHFIDGPEEATRNFGRLLVGEERIVGFDVLRSLPLKQIERDIAHLFFRYIDGQSVDNRSIAQRISESLGGNRREVNGYLRSLMAFGNSFFDHFNNATIKAMMEHPVIRGNSRGVTELATSYVKELFSLSLSFHLVVTNWLVNPLPKGYNEMNDAFSRILLTTAAFDGLHKIIPGMETLQDAAYYITRSSYTPEEKKLNELYFALQLEEKRVIVIDKPTDEMLAILQRELKKDDIFIVLNTPSDLVPEGIRGRTVKGIQENKTTIWQAEI